MTTFVIDTSVLLSDPGALERFEEHELVIPLAVINELEAKRSHPELGEPARRALRTLERLREAHGDMRSPMPVGGCGGTVRVEVNHQDDSRLPKAMRSDAYSHRVLTVAHHLGVESPGEVVLVAKDLPLRLKAGVVGVRSEEYRNEQVADDSYTGVRSVDVDGSVIDDLFHHQLVPLVRIGDDGAWPLNSFAVLHNGSQSALARVVSAEGAGALRLVRSNVEAFGLRPRSARQRLAFDLLLDEEVGIVSLGGPAGTGKSLLAIAAGLEAVIERKTHRRVLVFRPLHAVGGQDLGFLPGTEAEKMDPWAAAVFDALEAFCSPELIAELTDREAIQVLPLTHIRGRTLTGSFVVVDEAQNLERSVLLTALSRIGEGSRVVLAHDVAQRDNLHVGRFDGVQAVVERLKGNPLFGHVSLDRSERSAVAAAVADLLDDGA